MAIWVKNKMPQCCLQETPASGTHIDYTEGMEKDTLHEQKPKEGKGSSSIYIGPDRLKSE